jgi:hypothetical protein
MPLSNKELVDKAMTAMEENMSSLSNLGICHTCGHEQDGCEPDARNYECEECGEHKVFGAEETLMMLT